MLKSKWTKIAFVFILVLSMLAPSCVPVTGTGSVAEAATTVKITKTKLSLNVGKTYKLKITGTSSTVTWKSSKKTVATVSKYGTVSAKKAGTATITATVDGTKYTCKVTVKAAEVTQTTVYGKVTAISGSKITLALGTMNTPGSAGGQTGTQPSGVPEKPSDSTSGTGTSTGSTTGSGTGTGSSSGSTSGTQSSAPTSGQQGSAPEMITLTGDTITIKISDTSILYKQSMATNTNTSASLSDLSVGSILQVIYTSSVDSLVSVTIMGGGQPGDMASGGQQGGTAPGGTGGMSTASTGTGAYNLTNGESLSGGTYTSTNADENAVRAEGSITASLTDVAVTKTAGAASNSDASSFYGLNSAILALSGAILNITGGSVTASAEGSNGVFAYDGATINIKNTTIDVSGGNAGGIEVAGGGILNATNLTVTSKVKAAIRSDRGGGTLTVNGGTYTTSGSSGAPAVYSTAAITVNNAVLTANTSEAIVVEGLNSVTLNNCAVTGNMSGTYGVSSGENIHNVMLYQSMSGDAEVGNSSFTMTGGSLISKNGDMLYVTNTESVISLSDVALTLADGTNLLVVAGNDGSRGWGSAGSNGGICTFNVSEQTLAGNITVDKISKLTMSISDSSTYTGAINPDGTTAAALSVTLDTTSTWTLTADSYVTEFNGSMSNVVTNGHTLYVNGVAMN
jgi:hypothetical protein